MSIKLLKIEDLVRTILYIMLIIEKNFQVSNAKSKGKAHVLLVEGNGKIGHFLAERKVTLL